MNKLLKKNTLITLCTYLVVLLIVAIFFDATLGKDSSDFLEQHTKLLDFMRKNFWASHDLFPQWLMSLGLGQSFVVLYYYGLYNPFITLSYFIPISNPIFIFEFIFMIILVLNSIGMTMLLWKNGIKNHLNTVVTILYSFTPVFLFHINTHPMFIYYVPLLTLSLVSLHLMVDNKVRSLYAIFVGLIFYTNFTFAPVISILQFLYFLSLVYNRDDKWKCLSYFISSYMLGVGLGAFILIPTYLFTSGGAGRNVLDSTYQLSLFTSYHNIINYISTNKYITGMYTISIFALIGSLVYLRGLRYYILTVPMLIMLLFEPINYALNLFQYTHGKVYISYVPILWLLFALLIKKLNIKQISIVMGISICMMIIGSKMYQTVEMLFVVTAISFLIVYISKRHSVVINIVALVLLTTLNFATSTHYIPLDSQSLSRFEVGNQKCDVSNYRMLTDEYNYIDGQYCFSPTMYTSLTNNNFLKITREEYEGVIDRYYRTTRSDYFNNMYFRNFFAINSNDNSNVNPIVYGVDEQDVVDSSTLNQLSPTEKVYAISQKAFVENGSNSNYVNNFEIEDVYSSNNSFTLDSSDSTKIQVPEQFKNGELIIQFKADLAADDTNTQKISINDQTNTVMMKDHYGPNVNNLVTFYVDTSNINELNVKIEDANKMNIEYSDLTVKYQSIDNFNSEKLNVINPSNFEVDLNNSFKFNIDMKNDGIISTSIPYDRGFHIYVDGNEVDTITVNNLYIGADIPAGTHTIEISYTIPGFKIGLITAVFALLVILYFGYKEYKSCLKKNGRKK